MITKYGSLKVSEVVFDLVINDDEIQEDNRYMWLETFCNCREQGLCLAINEEHHLRFVWIFQARNSDDIVVVVSNNREYNNTFDEKAYSNRTHFGYGKYQECYEHVKKIILEKEGE